MNRRKTKRKGTGDNMGTPSVTNAEPRASPGSNDGGVDLVDFDNLLGTDLPFVGGHSSSDEGSETSSVHVVSNSMFLEEDDGSSTERPSSPTVRDPHLSEVSMVGVNPASSSLLMTTINLGGGSSSSSGGGGAALTAGTGPPAVPIGAGGGP
jgi:hypothetical protein